MVDENVDGISAPAHPAETGAQPAQHAENNEIAKPDEFKLPKLTLKELHESTKDDVGDVQAADAENEKKKEEAESNAMWGPAYLNEGGAQKKVNVTGFAVDVHGREIAYISGERDAVLVEELDFSNREKLMEEYVSEQQHISIKENQSVFLINEDGKSIPVTIEADLGIGEFDRRYVRIGGKSVPVDNLIFPEESAVPPAAEGSVEAA